MTGGQDGHSAGNDAGHSVEWEGVVRFRLPDGWRAEVEEHEGHAVAAFHPPAPAGGVLRLVTDRVAPKDGPDGAVAVLREMALRFVRPDDQRASDRIVEPWGDDGVLAQAVMMTEEDGGTDAHYLWLVGAERDGKAAAAMFSYRLPMVMDGDESCAGTLALLDGAIRAAEIL
ncbi:MULTISPECIES: hypothetical protein [Azospirillum]|uniref:DUF1795 domain-containing protein n=1 Tax=Azospirillum brasilense TaxID=192 RepID=A0A235HJM1_AZOBR|nr:MULTISPECIES: hypothetical protein [Azospirillum]OYD86040.1 hypothetical protein CHT98_00225 [Azospirillum brasilense]